MSLTLALLILIISTLKVLSSAREQSAQDFDRKGARLAAHVAMSVAALEVADALPRFTLVPDPLSPPPTAEEVERIRIGWLQTDKVADYRQGVLSATGRLRAATSMFGQHVSGKTLSESFAVLSHSVLEVFDGHDARPDATLESRPFDEAEAKDLRAKAISLACRLRSQPDLFKYETTSISDEVFERDIRPKLSQTARNVTRAEYQRLHSVDKAVLENGAVRDMCSAEKCDAILKQLTDQPSCIKSRLGEG